MTRPYIRRKDMSPKEIPVKYFNDIFQDFEYIVNYYFEKLNKPVWKDFTRRRFGLDDGVFRSLHDMGVFFKYTRERARQIECCVNSYRVELSPSLI